MNHAKKKRGVPDAMSGTPPRSVCGILCGQQKSVKSYSFKKLQKAKENTRNPKISGVVLELLGGFEPPTSSLPNGTATLLKRIIAPQNQRFGAVFHCFLYHFVPYLSDLFYSGSSQIVVKK